MPVTTRSHKRLGPEGGDIDGHRDILSKRPPVANKLQNASQGTMPTADCEIATACNPDCGTPPKNKATEAPDGRRPNYSYDPLDTFTNEIRILRILQSQDGSGNDIIHCTLSRASLDSLPPFEALSYTWGDASNRSHIIVNGKLFSVTKNLGEALQILRYQSAERSLWIDAICINQDDDGERSKQVAKMQTIYRAASCVICWLGTSTPSSKWAFSLMHQLDGLLPRKQITIDIEDNIREFIHDPDNVPGWAGLGELLDRSYWQRIWVVQEIAMARLITVVCGKNSIGWTSLAALQRWLLHFNNDLETLVQRVPSLIGTYRWTVTGTLNFREDLETVLATPPPLLELIYRHQMKGASDPRDKVYALVGLSSARNDQKNFQIDYLKPVGEVYTDVVRYALITTGVFNIIWKYPRADPRFHLPSWAPDLTCNKINEDSQKKVLPREYNRILNVKGFCLDKIAAVSDRHAQERFSLEHIPTTILAFHSWRSFFQAKKPNAGYSTKDDEDFCATVMCRRIDKAGIRNMPLSGYRKVLGAVVWKTEILYPNIKIDKELMSFRLSFSRSRKVSPQNEISGNKLLRSLPVYMADRRFIISSEGRIGLAFKEVRKGDKIFILDGCTRPVILRPRKEGGFIFMGAIHIHEYRKRNAEEDIKAGKYELREFELH